MPSNSLLPNKSELSSAWNALTGTVAQTKFAKQDFGPQDSVIASTVRHPGKAMQIFTDWVRQQEQLAADMPQQGDEGSMYGYAPSRETRTMAGINLAGLAQTGAFPGPRPEHSLGMFIGRKAKNWNKDAASKALKMLDEGVDPAQVWKEHLIGKMPDGAPFSEIDDSAMSYGKGFDNYVANGDRLSRVNEFINHPDLNSAYPEMMNKTGVLIGDLGGATGNYSKGIINLNQARFGKDNMQSTTLHELQHAIQDREGWAGGGNPAMMEGARQDYTFELKYLQGSDEYAKLTDRFNSMLANPDKYGKGLDRKEFNLKLANWYQNQPIIKKINSLESIPRDPHQAYLNLTGEAQARATQERLNMDMAARQFNYPLKGNRLAGVKLEDLINRYGDNGPSMSVDKLPDTSFSKAHKVAQQNASRDSD